MGAAWKKLPKGKDFNKVIEMIRTVKSLELESLCNSWLDYGSAS